MIPLFSMLWQNPNLTPEQLQMRVQMYLQQQQQLHYQRLQREAQLREQMRVSEMCNATRTFMIALLV